MALFGIDEVDLKRGEGEWTNMQPIVRKSFAALFDVISKQQEQISELNTSVSKLKRELDKKPDQKDISRQISECRVMAPDVLRKGDLSAVHSLLVDIKADVERKASIRYVDDSCQRKIDKSDISMRPLLQNAEHVSRLGADLAHIKQHIDKYDQLPAQISEIKAKAASKDDIVNVLARVDKLSISVAERLDSEAVLKLLSEKADVKEIDGRVDIILKHRHDSLLAETEALERMMLDHEHRLSTMEYSEPRLVYKDKKGSEPSRQLHNYTRIIEQSIAGTVGIKCNGVEASRRSAQIECMQIKLNDCHEGMHQFSEGQLELRSRVQRLEGNLMKMAEELKEKQSAQRNDISDLGRKVLGIQQFAGESLDEMENKLSSLYHKVDSGLCAPIARRVESIELRCNGADSIISTIQNDMNTNADKTAHIESAIRNIEGAVVTFNDGVINDVKKELHRLKSDKASISVSTDQNYRKINEKQQELELKFHDMDAKYKSQLDLSGSRFASVSEVAVTVRALKQTVKTIIDTTLQQNKKIQSFEASKEKGDDLLRSQLAVDINSRLHACELAVSKLADVELKSALGAKSIANLESEMLETKKMANSFQLQFSEFNAVARGLRMAQMSAQSSASVAQAATAVVEGLAQDFTRNHHDSDFMGLSGKHSERKSGSVQTNAAKETPMTTKIERLRMEKEKLLKGLYGDDI